MVKLNKPNIGPEILHKTTKKCRLTTAKNKIIACFNKNEKLVYNNIYTHDTIKSVLMVDIQKNKCCYCEKLIYDDFEVEHFRPKEAVIHNGALDNPGYYWLTYEWSNLLYSCNKCNKRKGNNFPLDNELVRARNHNMKITDESPQILNPCTQEPEDYLEFIGLEIVAKSGVNFNIGNKTIDTIKLDRNELFHLRSEKYFEIKTYVHDIYEITKNDEVLEKEARVLCADYLDSKTKPNEEFSMMVKCNYDKLKPNLIS